MGCANRALVRFDKIAQQAASRDFLGAAAKIRKQRSDLYGSHSELLYHLDLGLLYHYAGLYDSSVVFLGRAVKIQEDLFTKSITNEAASLLINDNVRPYRGRPYEIAWLHLFLAFDYLALEKPDDARVEIRQGEIFLDGVRRNAGPESSVYRDDGLFRAVSAMVYEVLDEKDDARISLEQAVKAYRDAGQPVPASLVRDSGNSEIVVVGELGRSPALGETVFWGTWVRDGMFVYHYRDARGVQVTEAIAAPIPPAPQREQERGDRRGRNRRKTRSGSTFHVKWALPALRETYSQSRVLRVARDSATYSGESFADTHDLLRQDLDANRATTLLRTVTRVLMRTLAAEEAKSDMSSGNPLLNLLFNVGTDVLGDQLEQADTRLWFLLPRTVQIVRIPVKPGRYTLDLSAENPDGRNIRSETVTVEVKTGEKKFVFFTSLR